jgi:antitoxin YqcF
LTSESHPESLGEAVLDHFENELSSIAGTWKEREDGTELPFRIFRFRGTPHDDVSTLTTYGLSKYALCQDDGSWIREEFISCVADCHDVDAVASVLAHVGDSVVSSGAAIARGEILRLPEDALGVMAGLIALPPTAFSESFYVLRLDGAVVAFFWLIPITSSEIDFAESHGWEALELRLVDADPDVYDLTRPAVV